jgi:threonine efflux protein
MNHFALFVSVATLWALAAMSPGPNFLVTARISITRSRGEGLLAVAGIGVGTAVWGAAGCFGVQALFIAAPWLYLTIKLIGAIYMVWFGARLLWSSYRANEADRGRVAPMGLRHSAFSLGLATTIANPRSAISVASIFATTMPQHPSLVLAFFVIATMVAVSVCWYTLAACLFTVSWLSSAYQRGRRWIDRVTGACFILFGARLVYDR